MYFKYSRRKGDDYIKFLLYENFKDQTVTHPQKEEQRLMVEAIDAYVTNLQKSISP